jgi:hypothetical protein
MLTLEKSGRMSLQEVERRKPFMSMVVCRDDHNQLCIVGCRTPYFVNYGLPHVQAQIKTKNHISKAIIKANTHGRMMPNDNDLYTSRPVRFKVADASELRQNEYVDVYILS